MIIHTEPTEGNLAPVLQDFIIYSKELETSFNLRFVIMPHLKIDTNVPRSKIPAGLDKELCKIISDIQGKPLKYCVTTINTDQIMSFGGKDGPCAQAILLSIGGLGVEENKKISKAVSEKMKESLGIAPTKMYIHFQEATTQEVGFDGTTFHDILG